MWLILSYVCKYSTLLYLQKFRTVLSHTFPFYVVGHSIDICIPFSKQFFSDNLFLLFLGWRLEQIHRFLWRRTVTTQEGQKALKTGWCAQTHHIYCRVQKQSEKKNFWCIGLLSPCLFWSESFAVELRWYVIKALTVIFCSTETV